MNKTKITLLTGSVLTSIFLPLIATISCSATTKYSDDWATLERNWQELEGATFPEGDQKLIQSSNQNEYQTFNDFYQFYGASDADQVFTQAWNKYVKRDFHDLETEFNSALTQEQFDLIKYKYNQNNIKVPAGKWYRLQWAYAQYLATKESDANKKIKIKNDWLHTIFWTYARKEVQATPQLGGYSAIQTWMAGDLWNKILKNWAQAYNSNSYWMDKTTEVFNKMYKKDEVRIVIQDVLNSLIDDQLYFPDQQEYVNWWHYEIGFPKRLINVIKPFQNVFSASELKKYMSGFNYFMPDPLYGHASKGAINNYRPTNKMLNTGGNLADNSLIAIEAAILTKDDVQIKRIVQEMYDYLIKYFVEQGDGFYRDGGFIQHGNIGYMGAYGAVLLGDIASVAQLLKNTQFDIFEVEPNFQRLFLILKKSLVPFMFEGTVSRAVAGRSVIRPIDKSSYDGQTMLIALAKLIPFADKNNYEFFASFIADQIKNWDEDHLDKWLKPYGLKAFAELNIANSNIYDQQTQMWSIDRTIVRSDNWYLTNSFHSHRTGNYEGMNGENLQGMYQGEGMTLLTMHDNLNMYDWRYWWGVDPYQLPGTSSNNYQQNHDYQTDLIQSGDPWRSYVDKHAQRQTYDLAGGTTFGDLGATFANMRNWDTSLTTSKSTFNLEGQIFVLGANSSVGNNNYVHTTIDNRMSIADHSYVALSPTDVEIHPAVSPGQTNAKVNRYSPVTYTGQNHEQVGYVWVENNIDATQSFLDLNNPQSPLQDSGADDISHRSVEQTARGYLKGRHYIDFDFIKDVLHDKHDPTITSGVFEQEIKNLIVDSNDHIKTAYIDMIKLVDQEAQVPFTISASLTEAKIIDREVAFLKRMIDSYLYDDQIQELYGLTPVARGGYKSVDVTVKTGSEIPSTRSLFVPNNTFGQVRVTEIMDWHKKPQSDYSRLNLANHRPVVFNIEQHFNRLSTDEKQFAYSIIPDTNDQATMIDMATRVKVIYNNMDVQAIEYTAKNNDQYLMINWLSPNAGNYDFSFFAGQDDAPVGITSNGAGSIIIKKTDEGFQSSVRGEDHQANFNVQFSKNIDHLRANWLDWQTESDNFLAELHDSQESINNLYQNVQFVRRTRVSLNAPNSYFVNPASLSIEPDVRYAYNLPIKFIFTLDL